MIFCKMPAQTSQNDNLSLGTGLFTPIVKQKKEKKAHLAVRDAILSINDTGNKSTDWSAFDNLRRDLIKNIHHGMADPETWNEDVNRLTNHVIGHGKIPRDTKKRGKLDVADYRFCNVESTSMQHKKMFEIFRFFFLTCEVWLPEKLNPACANVPQCMRSQVSISLSRVFRVQSVFMLDQEARRIY